MWYLILVYYIIKVNNCIIIACDILEYSLVKDIIVRYKWYDYIYNKITYFIIFLVSVILNLDLLKMCYSLYLNMSTL